jgi:hypothetical protein
VWLSFVFVVEDLSLLGCDALLLDKEVLDVSKGHGTIIFRGSSLTP